MTLRRLLLLTLCLVLVAACAREPRVRASIEAFSTLAVVPAGASVEVVPLGGVDPASLEFRTYADRVDASLTRRGFVVDSAEPAWRLALGYGIDDGREVVDSYQVPDYGYAWAGRATRGLYRGYYPSYRTEIVSRTVYTRHLVLALADAETGVEAWRVRVVSDGRCPSLAPVFDALLAAAFDGFPAAGARTVDVIFDPVC